MRLRLRTVALFAFVQEHATPLACMHHAEMHASVCGGLLPTLREIATTFNNHAVDVRDLVEYRSCGSAKCVLRLESTRAHALETSIAVEDGERGRESEVDADEA
jgi:hypothetical protein